MTVDVFWKRVPSGVVQGSGPAQLSDLVPHWFDDVFKVEQSSGMLVGTEDTGALISQLLRFGAGDGPGAAVVELFALEPSDWDDYLMVGSLSFNVTRQIAEFLSDAPLERWVQQHHAALAAEAQSMGYRRPFDEDWATQVLSDARELVALFRAAADNDEAIVVKVIA